ncbi:MerR family transcriptional regulator [Streptomyces klenkii]|uniref:MerR family transcriptional regulator n=1 Tax=Streptomyces klenkii TaxID=1420899 RepID=UPI003420AF02
MSSTFPYDTSVKVKSRGKRMENHTGGQAGDQADHVGERLRIGELSRLTGASPRSLRYYEQQGLLHAERDSNDYRSYPPGAAATVTRIREMLATGLSTEAIRDLLPCAQGGPALLPCSLSWDRIEGQMHRLDEEIAELTRRRAALARYADVMRQRQAGTQRAEAHSAGGSTLSSASSAPGNAWSGGVP